MGEKTRLVDKDRLEENVEEEGDGEKSSDEQLQWDLVFRRDGAEGEQKGDGASGVGEKTLHNSS